MRLFNLSFVKNRKKPDPGLWFTTLKKSDSLGREYTVAAQVIMGRFGGTLAIFSSHSASPQTITQLLGQLHSAQAITHFQSGLCAVLSPR